MMWKLLDSGSLVQQAKSQGPGTSSETKKEVDRLRADNARLLESNASLSEEVKSLTKQLLQAHADANPCLNLVCNHSLLVPLRPKVNPVPGRVFSSRFNMVYCYKTVLSGCWRSKSVYFTNRNGRGCLSSGQQFFLIDICKETKHLMIHSFEERTNQASKCKIQQGT